MAAALLLVFAVALVACAPTGDEPAGDPSPAVTTPTTSTSDSVSEAPDDGVIDEGDPIEQAGVGDGSVEEPDPAKAGDDKATVQDGTPNETRDPEVPLSELPTPTLEHPKYPDPEPEIPPPRD